jgi:hypothetical protein
MRRLFEITGWFCFIRTAELVSYPPTRNDAYGHTAYSGGRVVLAPGLPPLTRAFVMREEPWNFIEKSIFGTENAEETHERRILGVTGIGGCGKTQIILKFLRVHQDK